MKPEVNLFVYAVFPDGEIVQVGHLLSRNLGTVGRYEGFFKYSTSFLNHPKKYELDPQHLPLQEKVFTANNSETGLHSVFEDSLPDAWGRHILARKGGLAGATAPAHLLAVLQGGGLGRLLYTEEEQQPSFRDGSIEFSYISAVIEEAGKLERAMDIDSEELRHLLACGSSAGGARPKVLVSMDNQRWLAKFASTKDIHPELFVALENAGMTLAASAGLNVPVIKKISVTNRNVLFVRRFDLVGDEGRNALVSFKTLTGIYDPYGVSYSDLAAVIRKYSVAPGQDAELLYRQMITNILLVNTDDHLQNFAMLHTDKGWRLSPAYDIVPNIYQLEQILLVNGKHGGITAEDVIAEGRKSGLSVQRSKHVFNDVVDRLADWENVFANSEVPTAHTTKLRENIRKRIENRLKE